MWCLCGGVSSVRSPPLTVVVGGIAVVGGAVVDGGVALQWWVALQWKGGCGDGDPPVWYQCSPFVCSVTLVEWREGVCVVSPCLIGSGVLCCSVPLFFVLSHPSLCLLSQHCWFRVVSLWQVCVIVEWRWGEGV